MVPGFFAAGCGSSLTSHVMMGFRSSFVPDLRLSLWSIGFIEELNVSLRGSFKGPSDRFFFGSC
jgi:hypothetical protein